MDGLNRFNALLFQTAEQAVILFMGIIALVIPYEVFGRYVLGDMPMWSGDGTRVYFLRRGATADGLGLWVAARDGSGVSSCWRLRTRAARSPICCGGTGSIAACSALPAGN